MLPELVTSADEEATIPYRPPVMAAPALLITVAVELVVMPLPKVPVILPELVTLAGPVSAKTPSVPPMMLAPALLVTFAPAAARTPKPAVAVLLLVVSSALVPEEGAAGAPR